MMQEVRLMKLVQHPYVVRLYEVIDTQTKLYLVLEFADGKGFHEIFLSILKHWFHVILFSGGDMYDYIMKHEGGLEESMAKKYFRQIVTAIQYCHKLHVVHRDLKPENVVFFEKLGMVKLTDFGFSNKFDPGQRLQTSCGSLAYSAPEILLGDSYDAPAVGKQKFRFRSARISFRALKNCEKIPSGSWLICLFGFERVVIDYTNFFPWKTYFSWIDVALGKRSPKNRCLGVTNLLPISLLHKYSFFCDDSVKTLSARIIDCNA